MLDFSMGKDEMKSADSDRGQYKLMLEQMKKWKKGKTI